MVSWRICDKLFCMTQLFNKTDSASVLKTSYLLCELIPISYSLDDLIQKIGTWFYQAPQCINLYCFPLYERNNTKTSTSSFKIKFPNHNVASQLIMCGFHSLTEFSLAFSLAISEVSFCKTDNATAFTWYTCRVITSLPYLVWQQKNQ